MSLSDGFQELLSRAENGSQEAIWELVESFTPHVHRLISRGMTSSLKQRVGASDIVQATWASFLLGDHALSEFESEDDLRAYVCSIALNKLRMTKRVNIGTQSRDIRRETAFAANLSNERQSVTPSASEIIEFRDSWDSFMESQPEHYRQIVKLRLEGTKIAEIAQQLRLNERTVRRVLQKLVTTVAA